MVIAGSGSTRTRSFPLLYIDIPVVICIPHENSDTNISYYRVGYTVTTTGITIAERLAPIHLLAEGY